MSLLQPSTRLACSSFLFFLITILSVALASPQHCSQSATLLTSTQSCSSLGSHDLLTPIGSSHTSSQSPILIDPSTSFFPWTHPPICTPFLPEVHSKLCVYTNASFDGGRGISIFTTPKIAEEFASLPPFHDISSLPQNEANTDSGAWYTIPLPGKGIALLASRALKRGDRVTAYTPLLLAHQETSLSTKEREKLLRRAVEQLPKKSRDLYLSLSRIYGHESVIAQDVLKGNAFEMQVGGVMHLALFPETARMNHACNPNAQYFMDPSQLTHYVHASRHIKKDEEITISYTTPFQPHKDRQERLQLAFHFQCTCDLCSSPKNSDAVLSKINTLQQSLSQFSAGTEEAEELIALYENEGFESFLDTAYGHATLAYSAAGDSEEARRYAGLAAKALWLKEGEGARDLKMWREMVKSPEGHWSWKYGR